MPSTYLRLHYHFIFSTKSREAVILPSIRERLHEYLGGTIHGLEGVPEIIGGAADHVHLLVRLKATHCLADFMRELKKASSVWMHDEMKSPSLPGRKIMRRSPSVRRQRQEEHYRTRTFRDEFTELLHRRNRI